MRTRNRYFSGLKSAVTLFSIWAVLTPLVPTSHGVDISQIPWWDGETSVSPDGPLINRYGGLPIASGGTTIQRSATAARTGLAGYQFTTTTPIPVGGFGFFQTTLNPASAATSPGRDLRGFDQTSFWIRNDTGENFTLKFELKDYRDSNTHRAWRNIPVSATTSWQQIHIPLNLSSAGWNLSGAPDISRARFLGFVVEANQGQAVSGQIQFDDFQFRERGGVVDTQASPFPDIAARIAQRQFLGLWGSRNHNNGLIPVGSANVGSGGLNTTAAMVKMLPTAVRQGWITQAESDNYVSRVVATLNTTLNSANFVPPRYMNLQTLAPTIAEESVVDAAFMALALHQYKGLATTSVGLKNSIDAVQNRFNFAAFSDTQAPTVGWKLAYNTGTQSFTAGTYDGYSGEPWLISLAAHLANTHHVDITQHYHSAVFRSLDFVSNPADAHMVHSFEDFRAPFLQWLLPLFVDVSERGADNYPTRSLSTNPWENAQKYQRDVDAYFQSINRDVLLQLDAGDDGSGAFYQQFSAYNNFGRSDLFMPWSSSFAALGDTPAGSVALRTLLEKSLHGPLGLSDSARWTTGQADPSSIVAAHDFWNTSLSTMALFQFLYQDNGILSDLPEVQSALDRVFYVTWNGMSDGLWNSNSWNIGGTPPTARHDAQILSRTVTVTGIQAARTTRVRGGMLLLQGTLQSNVNVEELGTLAGSGLIDGELVLDGTFEIRQAASPLNVSGSIELGGLSELRIADSFTQDRGTTVFLTVLTSGDLRIGEFSNTPGIGEAAHLGYGHFLDEVVYSLNSVSIGVFAALPGDANGDGVVDGSDFGIWNANKFLSGTDWTRGDFNHDGITDGSDFGIWNANKFLGDPRLVPEPASAIIMAFIGLGGWFRNRSISFCSDAAGNRGR